MDDMLVDSMLKEVLLIFERFYIVEMGNGERMNINRDPERSYT